MIEFRSITRHTYIHIINVYLYVYMYICICIYIYNIHSKRQKTNQFFHDGIDHRCFPMFSPCPSNFSPGLCACSTSSWLKVGFGFLAMTNHLWVKCSKQLSFYISNLSHAHVCVYIYIYLCTCVYISVSLSLSIYLYIYIYTYIYQSVYTHKHVHNLRHKHVIVITVDKA